MIPTVKELLKTEPKNQVVAVRGWVRTARRTKTAVFVEVNDGSCMANLQCVFGQAAASDPAVVTQMDRATTGASVSITGRLIPSPAAGQHVEVEAFDIKVIGEAPVDTYPLQKKVAWPAPSSATRSSCSSTSPPEVSGRRTWPTSSG